MKFTWQFAATALVAMACVPGPTLCAQIIPPVAATRRVASDALAGIVIDSSTGHPLALAAIAIQGLARRTTTDLSGQFLLRAVPPGTYALDIKRIGYLPQTRRVVVDGQPGAAVVFMLTPLPFQLAEVKVAPGSFTFLENGPSTRFTFSRADIEAAPFGEDLFRAMNRLPGLSSGDYGAQFSIRGGRADETLILLDGLELYEPFHLKDYNEGALSIIDVDAIDGVELLTGGFSAHYGDKRSGVMNIRARTPQNDGTRLTLGASLTNAHALAEGTFANSKGSWLLSGRRGFIDLLLRTISKKETKAPTYQDAFGTVRYSLHPNHQLALNVLHASDGYRFTINGTTGFNDSILTRERANNGYGNSYAWFTVQSLVGEHLTIRSLGSVGAVNASREGSERHLLQPIELYGVNGKRNFTVRGVKQDLRYQRSEHVVFDWGYDVRWLHATYDWTNRVTQNPDNPIPDTTGYYPRITRREKTANGTTIGAYVSNRIQLLKPLSVEAGLRYDAANYTHDSDWSPRLQALLRLTEHNTLRAGWGQYRQRQGIADENAFDALKRYFPSELSQQYTLSFERQYASGGAFRMELYTKTGSHLRPILRNWKSGLNVFPESAEDRILVYPISTSSRGMELYHERKVGSRVNVRAGYALSFVDERLSRVDNINDRQKLVFDSTHRAPQDQRHALNVDVSYRPREKWSVNSALTFHSGWPFTDEIGVPVRKRNGTMDLAVLPDSLYAGRLPAYQRLDLRVTRRVKTAHSEFRMFVEAINLTNHENVLGYDVYRAKDASGALVLARDTETWFSILPSIGLSWSRRF